MEYKIVPFSAQLTREDSTKAVAVQMQTIVDAHIKEGWKYLRTDSIPTHVSGTNGCFGFGAQPAINTSCTVMVFEK
jgi:hypothetical protein